MLILCDFDGTITEQDITNLIWDHYTPGWREALLPAYRAGQVSHLQIMVDGYKAINAPAREMLDYVRQHVKLREGFHNFRETCLARQWRLEVVSGGIDFYIKAFLPQGIPFHSYIAELNEFWDVSLPDGVDEKIPDFKVHVLQQLKQKHAAPAVFIGDGRNDLPVARVADRVFTVRGSTLERLCLADGIGFTSFDTFNEVADALL